MKKYYECHITLEDVNRELIKEKLQLLGWTFSAIDGDPIIGKGVKCYATHHYNCRYSEQGVIQILETVAKFLEDCGLYVIRKKIELVIYDTKSEN